MIINRFLIIDSSRAGEKLEPLMHFQNSVFSYLFSGKKGNKLKSVSPIIFDVSNDDILWKFMEVGWGKSWGVLFYSTYSLKIIRKQLKNFLIVQTEYKKKLYFRFYDPRVLRIFLPTCNEEQLKEFFGSVDYFICEDENPEEAIVFSLEDNNLITKKITKEEAQQFNPVAKKKRFSFF